jgi:small GTP-binding protein
MDASYKIIIIGDASVGKTSIMNRYSGNDFNEGSVATISTDFILKNIEMDGKKIKLQIWDTAGQEKFRTLMSSYYRRANGVIIVYDITKKTSFANVQSWYTEAQKNIPDATIMLIGNKNDLEMKRDVQKNDGKDFAEINGMSFYETSARTNDNINASFEQFVRVILEMSSPISETKPEINLQTDGVTKPSGGCC